MSIKQETALQFFVELRRRLIYFLLVLFTLLMVLLYFANSLYTLLAAPLLKYIPQGHLIATEIVSPFFVPFKLAFMLAFLLSMPFLLYQVWKFVAPALYLHERRIIWPFLIISCLLFYAGMSFAYFIIFPMLFHFLAKVAPQGVAFAPDIRAYLDFSTQLLLVFGVLFEIPIAMVVLVLSKLVTRQRLKAMRSYAIVCAFIIGMLFAPPDVISQTILAIPIWLLYEIGILLQQFVQVEGND